MSETWLERKVGWIASSDYTPNHSRPVIVTDNSGRVRSASFADKKWLIGGNVFPNVTHWMEFPNPPAQFELDRVVAILKR